MKKKLLLVLLFFYRFLVFSENYFDLNNLLIAKEILDGNNSYLNSEIPDIALAYLNKRELRLLRNQIYAKRNCKFKSEDLTNYFSNFSWYKPMYESNEVEKYFNDIDYLNITKIKEYEKCEKKNHIPSNAYLKVWQYDRDCLGEGFLYHFWFKKSNNFMYGIDYELIFNGKYEIFDNCIVLNITEYNKDLYPNIDEILPIYLCLPRSEYQLHSERYDKYNNQQYSVKIGPCYWYSFDERYLFE